MIATHDSYTYQKARNIFINLFSMFWKCQKLDIKKQYELGARVFDVRVYRYKNKWYTAHGLARFKDVSFNSLVDICEYFKNEMPNSYIRIYLEDNVNNDKNKDIKELFLREAKQTFELYKDMIWGIGTHFPWHTYYSNENFNPRIKEYYCHPFNWNTDKDIKYNLKHIDLTSWSLPLYAKKHNPIITKEMIEDPKVMYIMDYIGIYPKQ